MEFSKNFIAGQIFQRIEQMNWKILELSERSRNDHELITSLIFTFNKISLKVNTISPSKLEAMIKIIEESVGSRLRDLKELQTLTDKVHLQEKWSWSWVIILTGGPPQSNNNDTKYR